MGTETSTPAVRAAAVIWLIAFPESRVGGTSRISLAPFASHKSRSLCRRGIDSSANSLPSGTAGFCFSQKKKKFQNGARVFLKLLLNAPRAEPQKLPLSHHK